MLDAQHSRDILTVGCRTRHLTWARAIPRWLTPACRWRTTSTISIRLSSR
jgi:hypothetical protein